MQWRTPSLGEVDIMVTGPDGKFVNTRSLETKISDGSTWSNTYKAYERAVYHKWQFDPGVRIREVSVQLLNAHWC